MNVLCHLGAMHCNKDSAAMLLGHLLFSMSKILGGSELAEE